MNWSCRDLCVLKISSVLAVWPSFIANSPTYWVNMEMKNKQMSNKIKQWVLNPDAIFMLIWLMGWMNWLNWVRPGLSLNIIVLFHQPFLQWNVPAGSPSHEATELAHSLLFCSCVYFCLYGPFNCILFQSVFSLCSSGLISALLILSTIYLFSPDINNPSGWLGSKHQWTN